MRLDRFLVSSGLGSRKEVKKIIKDKKIFVNEQICLDSSLNIDEYKDKIKHLNDEIVYHKFYYLLLNKPEGYVSSTKKEGKYLPVTELVKEYEFANVFPVGRLDVDSTGVLLMTNNGTLAHQLLSPKYHVDKIYEVEVDFPLKDELIKEFEKGIIIDNELTLPAKLEIISPYKALVTLHEGKFHQVKRMFLKFSYKVISLNRIQFAFLTLNGIKKGEYRMLANEEILKLEELTQHKTLDNN